MVILTLEGFNLPSGYIVKELTIIFNDDSYQHFHFNAPKDFFPTAKDLRTINYVRRHLNGLSLSNDCLLPYTSINDILNNLTSYTIYVAGNSAHKFIMNHLPLNNIIDICSEYDFKYPEELLPMGCFKQHNPRYCSLSKAKYIKSIIKELLKSV